VNSLSPEDKQLVFEFGFTSVENNFESMDNNLHNFLKNNNLLFKRFGNNIIAIELKIATNIDIFNKRLIL
jgi:hypothetical protein